MKGVKNHDKTKKGENAAPCDLNELSADKRAPLLHFFLPRPPSFFPIALLRETKRDIGEIKRDIGQTEWEIVSTKRAIGATKRALVFAKRDKIPKKSQKTTSRGGHFSHLKAGVARPKKYPPKSPWS